MLFALGHMSRSASVSVQTLVDSRMCQMDITRHLRAPLPSTVIEKKCWVEVWVCLHCKFLRSPIQCATTQATS